MPAGCPLLAAILPALTAKIVLPSELPAVSASRLLSARQSTEQLNLKLPLDSAFSLLFPSISSSPEHCRPLFTYTDGTHQLYYLSLANINHWLYATSTSTTGSDPA